MDPQPQGTTVQKGPKEGLGGTGGVGGEAGVCVRMGGQTAAKALGRSSRGFGCLQEELDWPQKHREPPLCGKHCSG